MSLLARTHACVLALVLLPTAVCALTEIDTCDFVQIEGNGSVTTDLDCSASPVGFALQAGRTLDFQGHTVLGANVGCMVNGGSGSCTVRGPGTLGGSVTSAHAIVVSDVTIVEGSVTARRVTIKDSSITGPAPSGNCAVEVPQEFTASKARILATIIDGAACGIDTEGGLTLKDSTITGCTGFGVDSQAQGFGSDRVRIRDSTISDNVGFGVRGTSVRVLLSTVVDNGGIGIHARSGFGALLPRLTVKKSTVSRNDHGAALEDTNGFGTKGAKIAGSDLSDNARFGVTAGTSNGGRLRITSSILTGNGGAVACGVSEPCADIAASVLPDLRKTMCHTSYQHSSGVPGQSWGICALD